MLIIDLNNNIFGFISFFFEGFMFFFGQGPKMSQISQSTHEKSP